MLMNWCGRCDRADWDGLAEHVGKKHWREVFLLAVEMMESADKLLELMKKKSDDLVIDERLQKLLKLVKQKSVSELLKLTKQKSDSAPKKSAVIRALCFSQNLGIIKHISANSGANNSFLNIKSSSTTINDNTNSSNLFSTCCGFFSFMSSHDLDLAQDIEADFVESNLQLYMEIGQPNNSFLKQFSNEQKELLQQYYDANKLLVNCMNSGCKVSKAVKEEIEETLLLPIDEIKKRQQQVQVTDVAGERAVNLKRDILIESDRTHDP